MTEEEMQIIKDFVRGIRTMCSRLIEKLEDKSKWYLQIAGLAKGAGFPTTCFIITKVKGGKENEWIWRVKI